jgi:hypothetical protein
MTFFFKMSSSPGICIEANAYVYVTNIWPNGFVPKSKYGDTTRRYMDGALGIVSLELQLEFVSYNSLFSI